MSYYGKDSIMEYIDDHEIELLTEFLEATDSPLTVEEAEKLLINDKDYLVMFDGWAVPHVTELLSNRFEPREDR